MRSTRPIHGTKEWRDGKLRGGQWGCLQESSFTPPKEESQIVDYLLLLSARSVNNKASLIQDLIKVERAVLACITETWMTPEMGVPLLGMGPARFWVWHQPRPQGKAGGVAVIIRESPVAFRSFAPQISGCESLFLKLDLRDQLALLLAY